ncbi:hypothetical protein Rhopal_000614-T1 [Rhodotorula paludigena]|uniref:Phosphatidylinositol N-acetylglucosaminyltransferase subunit H conserved domain-containing protein n=1 Tax=Rhodotorula paludigena TaxID=86838 RepID=A0AAV5GCT0_9BASI|nr:hypothetical protein Rhopal_000614-T1 [Rhodotorula paludigena]
MCSSFSFQSTAQPVSLPLLAFLASAIGGFAALHRNAPAALATVAIFLLLRRGHAVRESLKIFPGLGVQLESQDFYTFTPSFRSTASRTWSLPGTTRITSISSNGSCRLVLNEGLQGAQVSPYLALLHGAADDKLLSRVIFPFILPRLEHLTPVLQEAQRLLAEPVAHTALSPPSL